MRGRLRLCACLDTRIWERWINPRAMLVNVWNMLIHVLFFQGNPSVQDLAQSAEGMYPPHLPPPRASYQPNPTPPQRHEHTDKLL